MKEPTKIEVPINIRNGLGKIHLTCKCANCGEAIEITIKETEISIITTRRQDEYFTEESIVNDVDIGGYRNSYPSSVKWDID